MSPPGCSQTSAQAVARVYAARLTPPSKDSAQATVGLPLAANFFTPSRSCCIDA